MDIPFVRSSPDQWAVEFRAFARAFGGAILFGIPLLFTMEMWWIGEFQPRVHLLGFVAITLLANVFLSRMSGFRRDEGSWTQDVAQAVEAMAVGIVLSIVVLAALGRIDGHTSLVAIYGMVAVQVVPLSLGAVVGNIVFDPSIGRTGGGDGGATGSPALELFKDVAATFVGAMFVGFAVAPTEEIPMLAAGLNVWNVFGIMALSMVAGYVIVFASGFDRSHHDRHVGGLFQRPFSETVLAYVVSLVAALLLLVGFGQVAVGDPTYSVLQQVLVLAVPATIGGAAGRVVV